MEEEQSPKESCCTNENNGVIICLIGMLIAVIVILGGIAMMGEDDDDDDENDGAGTMEANQAYVDLMAIHIANELVENQEAVEALATTSHIAPVFTSGSQDDLDRADSVIDNYRATFDVTVIYLMNETGMTIASTNRDTNGSFVGHNYGFRPYFQDAIAGQPGHYFALGVTSGTRGYYSSYPVKDENGTIVGVAVIKKEIDFIEESFVSKNLCFLVSPDGIIFLSSDDTQTMKSLWKLDQTTTDRLVASNEFGPGPFANLFESEPQNGDVVKFEGNEYNVLTKSVHEDGWTMVMLTPDEGGDDDD
jgi:C4-dicarboxylate-specific signal transduction histidine kinase